MSHSQREARQISQQAHQRSHSLPAGPPPAARSTNHPNPRANTQGVAKPVDRGQSATVGYALVFMLMITAVSSILFVAVPALESAQGVQADSNVETAFELLTVNINNIHQEGDASRTTEIQAAEGDIKLGEPTQVQLATPNATYSTAARPIIYTSSSGTQVVYELGQTMYSSSGSDATLTQDPVPIRTTEPVIIPIITTSATSQVGPQSGIVQIQTIRNRRGKIDFAEKTTQVNMSVTSPYADAWAQRFSSLPAKGNTTRTVTRSGDTVTLSITTPPDEPVELLVYRTNVEVSIT